MVLLSTFLCVSISHRTISKYTRIYLFGQQALPMKNSHSCGLWFTSLWLQTSRIPSLNDQQNCSVECLQRPMHNSKSISQITAFTWRCWQYIPPNYNLHCDLPVRDLKKNLLIYSIVTCQHHKYFCCIATLTCCRGCDLNANRKLVVCGLFNTYIFLVCLRFYKPKKSYKLNSL